MATVFQDWGLHASLQDVREGLRAWMQGEVQGDFDAVALALFRWQAEHNLIYSEFVQRMGVKPDEVKRSVDIPCLPVELFKTHAIQSEYWPVAHTFRSSGTTQMSSRSQHCLDADGLAWYRWVARHAWREVWGCDVNDRAWLGLLPGYVGREDASLLTMVVDFMEASGGSNDDMLMHDHLALLERLRFWAQSGDSRHLVLFGVTWAILDWVDGLSKSTADAESIPWSRVTLMDTGGMKGRSVEPIREEVHERIRGVLPHLTLASEYGMTEMLSQGYAKDGHHHVFPAWVKPVVREMRDPRSEELWNRTGRLDVLDLANAHSCAFLATSDAAQWTDKGLVLLGRLDHSEARGCSLLAAP